MDTLFFTRKLKDSGVGVVFTIDNIDTRDCDGELRLTIMASIAQEESRKTSERVKWGENDEDGAGGSVWPGSSGLLCQRWKTDH